MRRAYVHDHADCMQIAYSHSTDGGCKQENNKRANAHKDDMRGAGTIVNWTALSVTWTQAMQLAPSKLAAAVEEYVEWTSQ